MATQLQEKLQDGTWFWIGETDPTFVTLAELNEVARDMRVNSEQTVRFIDTDTQPELALPKPWEA